MRASFRHTKIIFTIGPACDSEQTLEQLVLQGADICRINMAHADHEWTRTIIRRIKQAEKETGRQIGIMMDVKGPEIRTGKVVEPIHLKKGEKIVLVTDPENADPQGEKGDRTISVNYPAIGKHIKAGDVVLVDNGLIRFKVTKSTKEKIYCKVEIPGILESRRHINLPGVKIELPSLTTKDMEDIKVGLEEGVASFALSFVRSAKDIHDLRKYLKEKGSIASIVAKIEDQTAISNLEEIIEAADAIMIARGDLGIECPFEELPIIQRRTVDKCIKRGKPVIVATHMLESMISAPLPTRAEVTDVANAVEEQADCIMLSGETAVGKYPLSCVRTLHRIAKRIEASRRFAHTLEIKLQKPKAKMLRSAIVLCKEVSAAGIIVYTRSGHLAQVLSSLRPSGCPIFAFTDVPMVHQQLHYLWGVQPFHMHFDKDPEVTILESFKMLTNNHWVHPGDSIVVISNLLVKDEVVDSIQLRTIKNGFSLIN